eukprot:gene788-1261_t
MVMWFIFVRERIAHVIDAGGFDDDVYNLARDTLRPKAGPDDARLNSAVVEFATHPCISISAALQGAIGLCNGWNTDANMNWSRMILAARLCLTRNGRPTDKVVPVDLLREVGELPDMADVIDAAPDEFDGMLRSYDQ